MCEECVSSLETFIPGVRDKIDHIEAANRYDRRLYEHCKARFVRCVAAEGEAFRDDLRLLTLIIEALGHSHFPSQPTVEEVARNLNGFIDDLCRNDRAADAVKVLRGINAKPDMGAAFCRDILKALAIIASPHDLAEEVRGYRERYGEDEFLKTFVRQLSG